MDSTINEKRCQDEAFDLQRMQFANAHALSSSTKQKKRAARE
jgi:hypothetical protein